MSSDPKPEPAPRRPVWSLAFRISAWYVVAFVASLAALISFAIPTVRAAFARADTVVLESQVDRHVAVLSTGLPAYRTAVEGALALGNPEVPVRVRDARGTTLYAHGDLTASRLTTERTTGELHVEIGATESPWPAVVGELRTGALVLALGAIALAVLGGYALTRRGLRPVRELAAAVQDVTRAGELSRRVPERGTTDELDQLSALFNRMLARNQELVAGMRDALDNVAHDLRTPLTRLRGTAELALGAELPVAREALAVCIEESDQVLRMLRTLMDISEAETGILRLERAPVSLGKLAADAVDLYDHVAQEAGVALTVARTAPAMIDADPVRIRQAIANLVDNALKYTPRGGAVTLGVDATSTEAIVHVTDTGEGIDSAAIPRIWDRLYRAEPSRSKPGLGLGLSLVRAIVVAHGGRVAVDSTPGRGSTFTLALPLRVTGELDGSGARAAAPRP
ncbi:MAG TPA: HAMP domain-containing sensor histidine kinase [Kofleriaceae bacterium]|jgi:signal transduction histidine kinase|nr:HAMP domain-containing sensor histidine kinase [Kofleriaceae bacterium]